ncbi:hypothetical protein [Ferruginibacter sp.]
MKNTLFKLALFAVTAFATPLILSGCDKDDDETTTTNATAKEYFVNNMLNKELVVPLATDNNVNITAKFDGMSFAFTDTTALAGVATASNGLLSVKGTWTVDAGYENISFSFPTNIIADLAFTNKQWHFINRDSATVKLNAVAETGDAIYFSKK